MTLIASHRLGDIMILRLYLAVMACVLLAGCSVNFQPYTRGPSADSIEDFADEHKILRNSLLEKCWRSFEKRKLMKHNTTKVS